MQLIIWKITINMVRYLISGANLPNTIRENENCLSVNEFLSSKKLWLDLNAISLFHYHLPYPIAICTFIITKKTPNNEVSGLVTTPFILHLHNATYELRNSVEGHLSNSLWSEGGVILLLFTTIFISIPVSIYYEYCGNRKRTCTHTESTEKRSSLWLFNLWLPIIRICAN